jgi:hypothetical protein
MRASFMELCMDREANGCFQWRLSGIAFFASTSTSLGSVEQQGLGEDRVLMGLRRKGALSGVVVASSASSTKFIWILTLKIALRFDGGGGLYGVHKTCSLKSLLIRMYAPVSSRVRFGVRDCSQSCFWFVGVE